MSTILLWIRILLTLIVLFFPLFHVAKWLFSAFQQTTKHLQNQIDLAKDRIRQEPEPREEEINERNHEDGGIGEEDSTLADNNSDSEEDFIPATEPLQVAGEIKIEEQQDLLANNLPKSTPSPESKQPVSGYSAEKLAQTVDDIKYAALTYKERGKKDEYEKKLVEGISLVGDHEEFLTMLADHYFEAGHYVKAATLLKKIIHINPENHRAIWQLGQIYAHDNDKETAKLLLEKARDLKDDNPKYLISLVEIYYEENNIRECITIVEKLSKLRPTNIDYLLTLGKLHEELNQPTKAHSYYMKVQELNPTNDEAKQAIRRLL